MAKGFGNDWRGLSANDPRIKRVVGGTIPSQSFPSGESVKPKYGNRRSMTNDGKLVDSKKQAGRWNELLLLEKAGHISALMPEPSFPVYVDGTRTGRFTFDSMYIENGRLICEDVKSKATKTTAFQARKRVFMAVYKNIEFREWL